MSKTQIRKKVQIKEKSTPKKSKWWLWLLIALAVIAIILFLWKPWVICHTTDGTPRTLTEQVSPAESTEQVQPATETPEEVTTPTEETVNGETPAESTEQTQAATETPEEVTTPTEEPVSVEGDFDELVQKTIRGDFGNGDERKQKLGDRYSEIQRRVNKIYQENGYMW
jgi:cytoskeletal protein RodZ